MTDRIPGAPGQYTAVVTAAEFVKMQQGQAFTITLTRDDQPVTEGTPYNKASVLPDDLAAMTCPDVTDPTPADAIRGITKKFRESTLLASGWSPAAPYTQTVYVDGVASDMRPHIGPMISTTTDVALAQLEAWAMVSKAVPGNDAVTFTCLEDKPEVDIPIQIEVCR